MAAFRRLLILVVISSLALAARAEDWPKYRHDLQNTGFSNETGIDSTNVAGLKLLWKFNAGKGISASPAVATVNGTRMVFFGAWSANFYAVNADTGALVWTYVIDKVGTCMLGGTSSCPMIGSSATVDNGVVYFGASNAYVYALNAATGALIWKTQIGDPNNGGDVWSSPVVYNGLVYVGLSSHDDIPCVIGKIMALRVPDGSTAWSFTTLDPTSCPSGTCVGAAVWATPALDTTNNILYVGTGNPGSSCNPSTANATRYPDSIMAFNATTGALLNWYQAISNDTNDNDFGSSPILFNAGTINACTGTNTVNSWVGELNKGAGLYVVQRNTGGLITSTANRITLGTGSVASPALFPQTNISACSPTQSATTYTNNVIAPLSNGYVANIAQDGTGAFTVPWKVDITGTMPIRSAPAFIKDIYFFGGQDNVFRAMDMSGKVLWSYTMGNRVYSGPAISNNMVYVGSQDANLYAFGFGGTPTVATPTFSPSGGTYDNTLSGVTISTTTSGATIYYTTDGSTPTTSSTQYTAPIPVNTTTTIKAIGVEAGFNNSSVASATYTLQAGTPTFTPAAGNYTSTQSVSIATGTTGATIYYTTDGTTPSTSSAKYTGSPITVSSTTTIKAIAVASGFVDSNLGSATYTIGTAGSGINYSGGFTSTGMQFNGSAKLSTTRLRLTDGKTSEAASAFFTTPVDVQSFTTDYTIQLTSAIADGMTFTIQNNTATAIGPAGGGLGYGEKPGTTTLGIPKSVAVKFDIYSNSGEGTDSTGIYTNGVSPTLPAVDLSNTGIVLRSGDVFGVHMTYDGATLTMTITDQTNTSIAPFTTSWPINIPGTVGATSAYVGFTGGTGGSTAIQDVLVWTYTPGTTTPTAATPTFTPPAGSYSSAQSVTINDSTPGATLYYTTDGSTPTTNSSVFNPANPIPVSSTTTIKAIAAANGYNNSAVGSATYTITQPVTPSPAFSPLAGTYNNTLSVTLDDADTTAVIYYTTDGSTPTTSSTQFTGTPIPVNTTTTINAIAVESGKQNSPVASATYVLQAAAPIFSPPAGTYATSQSVSLSSGTTGASIFYTTDGSTPTTTSTMYTGTPIAVSVTTTIKAIATAANFQNSTVASATYTIGSSTTVSYPTFTSTGLQLNGATIVSGRLRLTDGGTYEHRSAWYSTQVNIGSFTTDFDFQLTNAKADGFTFTIQNSALTALGPSGGGLGYGPVSTTGTPGIGKSVAVKFDLYSNNGEGTNSTGMYTNGASPTIPAVTISTVNLHSGDLLHAHITYNGTTLTLTLTDKTNTTVAPFTTSWNVNIPNTVGGTSAWIGFTAGTGGSSATQEIVNWSYTTP